jgi:hypothetical protein
MIMVLGLPELEYRLDSTMDKVISVVTHAIPIANAINKSGVKFNYLAPCLYSFPSFIDLIISNI